MSSKNPNHLTHQTALNIQGVEQSLLPHLDVNLRHESCKDNNLPHIWCRQKTFKSNIITIKELISIMELMMGGLHLLLVSLVITCRQLDRANSTQTTLISLLWWTHIIGPGIYSHPDSLKSHKIKALTKINTTNRRKIVKMTPQIWILEAVKNQTKVKYISLTALPTR